MTEQGEGRPRRAATPDGDQGAHAEHRQPDEAGPARRRLAPWLAAGAVVVVGGIVAGSLLVNGAGPTSTPTPTVDPIATYLLQPADLAGLRESVVWEAASTDSQVAAGTPQPTCLAATADTEPAALNTLVRTFAPADAEDTAGTGGVLHQVDTYASPEEAAGAYAARVTQLAACARNTALLVGGWDVAGLADESTAATYVFQDTEDEYHTFVVARTGARVNILDATQPDEPADVAVLAAVASEAAARQCADGGTCPAEVAATPAAPLPTEPLGWLSPVDLPRLTAGAGTWRGTEMPELRVVGTRCENADLGSVPDATQAEQRTYLLADDASVPPGFGLDEVVYLFPTAEQASAFAGSVVANIDGCADRAVTAEVTRVSDLTGAGTGAAWTITQQTDENNTTATFRVSVQAVGDRVVYLMANPSADADFSDAAWGQLSVRAAERVAQTPEEVAPASPSPSPGSDTAGPDVSTEPTEPAATP